MEFLKKLTDSQRLSYDYFEDNRGHTERFKELLDKPTNDSFPFFTDEEIEYLGNEDLTTFMALFPDEAHLYMDNW